MKRSVRILVMMVPLVLLVAACMPEPTLRSDLFLDDDSLLTGEPCAAPCWNGITPGETTWEDANSIVSADEGFEGIETNAEGGMQQAVWQKAGSGQYCCRLIADDTDGATISYIFLALSSPRIIVDNVLDTYGDPAYVTTFPFTSTESVVQLIYPDVPMVVSALVGDSESSLLANSDVVAVLYMDQAEMDLILQTTELKAWAGYQSYGAYDQGTPVVTPAITLTPAPEQ
jgi:hypothetical protein